MSVTILVLTCTVLMVISAYTSIKIRENVFPYYTTLISSFLQSLVWMFALGFSKISLLKLSAIMDVVYCTAFYFALYCFGEPIKLAQLIGLVFMLVGMWFVNK